MTGDLWIGTSRISRAHTWEWIKDTVQRDYFVKIHRNLCLNLSYESWARSQSQRVSLLLVTCTGQRVDLTDFFTRHQR